MADVFVSYSRRDGAFVSQLHEALRARGKQVWVDVEGIRDAEVFPAAIRSAIESSDAFAFVISPDSVESALRRRLDQRTSQWMMQSCFHSLRSAFR